jgi:hypothetical protein
MPWDFLSKTEVECPAELSKLKLTALYKNME